jgi:hypothetical protein
MMFGDVARSAANPGRRGALMVAQTLEEGSANVKLLV